MLAGTAGALRNLTVTDEIAKHIALAGGLEALIAAAEAHPESAEVQSEAAGALWGLAITEEIAEAICAKGGIKVLTTALTKAAPSTSTCVHVLTTALSPLPQVLVKAGAAHLDMHARAHPGAMPPSLQVLVDAFARHQSSLEVARAAADAMWGLSVNDEVSGAADGR